MQSQSQMTIAFHRFGAMLRCAIHRFGAIFRSTKNKQAVSSSSRSWLPNPKEEEESVLIIFTGLVLFRGPSI
jgi:hypothetical protein